jgi:multidrug efflux system membrane fusion protein
VGTDQGTKFVLVVGADNVVSIRPVELGPEVDGLRVVRNGLKGDEQIIVNGVVNARPGSKVSPEPGDMSQFLSNQLQLQTSTKIQPEGEGKEKAGATLPHQAQGQAPSQGAQSKQPKPGGGG